MPKKNPVSLSFDTLRLEGSLFLPDILEKAARGELVESQSPDQYQIPKGLTLQDEYGRAFLIAQAQWKSFATTLDRQDLDAVESTRQFVQEFLRDALGFGALEPIGMLELAERRFPISLMARRHVPVVVAPHTLELDDPDARFAIGTGACRPASATTVRRQWMH